MYYVPQWSHIHARDQLQFLCSPSIPAYSSVKSKHFIISMIILPTCIPAQAFSMVASKVGDREFMQATLSSHLRDKDKDKVDRVNGVDGTDVNGEDAKLTLSMDMMLMNMMSMVMVLSLLMSSSLLLEKN